MVSHKSFLVSLILCLLFNVNVFSVNEYEVADVSSGNKKIIESFSDYDSANKYYLEHLDDYDNLVLYQNDVVLKMEYGIVEFISNDSCTLNIGYNSLRRNDTSSINACYAIDGAYLYSSDDSTIVYFKLADDIGYTDFIDVILHPIDLLDVKISTYVVRDDLLYHQIKTQLDLDYYANIYAIDKAPSYLEENVFYYSYDGHYFYKDFKKMIDDYLNKTYENALNFDSPYYNYYEYLPFHSLTNYDYKEIDDYYNDVLKINGKLYYYDDQVNDGANDIVNRSQYYGELSNFFLDQNIYGTNALMLLSISRFESSDGKSLSSYISNNVFDVYAYDVKEKADNRYQNIKDSINAYAKYYINGRYCNYLSSKYAGSFLGNKYSGINLNYSKDPYWGEKVSSSYFNLDSSLGYKDYQKYCLGIIYENNIDFYNDENLSTIIYSLNDIHDYSLIILKEYEDSYKVQIDNSGDYLYDFNNLLAYINKEDVDLILNLDNIHENDLTSINYDFDGGNIDGYNALTIYGDISLVRPTKDGFVFYKYEKIEKDDEITYKAIYKEIDKIEVFNLPSVIDVDSYLNIKDAYVLVTFKDGSKEKVILDTNMLSCVYFKEVGTNKIEINYSGVAIEKEIEVVTNDNNLKDLIDKNISSYKKDASYDLKEVEKIKSLLKEEDYNLNFEELRILDTILLKKYHNKFNYLIDENEYDLSLSGLGLSIIEDKNINLIKPFVDTYKIRIKDIGLKNKKKLRELGMAYEFNPVTYFEIEYFLNGKEIAQEGPIIFSMKLENKKANAIYTVYRLDENDNIYKCKTIQSSNYIYFLSKENGKYVVLEKDGFNNYESEDNYENLTSINDDIDTYRIFIEGMIMFMLIIFGYMNILYAIYLNKELNRINNKKIFSEKTR